MARDVWGKHPFELQGRPAEFDQMSADFVALTKIEGEEYEERAARAKAGA